MTGSRPACPMALKDLSLRREGRSVQSVFTAESRSATSSERSRQLSNLGTSASTHSKASKEIRHRSCTSSMQVAQLIRHPFLTLHPKSGPAQELLLLFFLLGGFYISRSSRRDPLCFDEFGCRVDCVPRESRRRRVGTGVQHVVDHADGRVEGHGCSPFAGHGGCVHSLEAVSLRTVKDHNVYCYCKCCLSTRDQVVNCEGPKVE